MAPASTQQPAHSEETSITLTCTAGVNQGQSYRFTGHDTFLIGRSPKAHFQLPPDDRFFSRVHFMIELNPPQCRLMDMGSRNGTYVNGAKVESVELRDGDKIKAGRTVLEVHFEHGEPAAPATEFPTATYQPPRDTPPFSPPSKGGAGGVPPALTPGARPQAKTCPSCGAPLAAGALVCAGCQEQSGCMEQPIVGYRIIRELGRGGMGVVSLAVRDADGSAIALKTITPLHAGSQQQVERFLREARILQQLDHPHIVGFRDMGECHGQLYFAMDFSRGQDASQALRQSGPLSVPRAVDWVCQLLQALDYAHAKNFVHRDIKPANLLVEPRPDGQEHVRVADFGLARVYQGSPLSGLTLQGDVGGTLGYMAPEQITAFRESKPSVDLYAAAATLYHLLTAKLIFDFPKDVSKRLLMILHDDPVPIETRRTDLPPALCEVLRRALRKNPEDRYADARDLRRALLPFRAP